MGFLVDLGYFTRLDYVNPIFPRELQRHGFNRYDLFGYGFADDMIMENLKGPLNVMFFVLLLYFFASITRVARFHIMTSRKSKKINFASEAFIMWGFDRFVCIAQLHLLILAMVGGSTKHHGIESTCIMLILVAHCLARNVIYWLWKSLYDHN